MQLKTQKRLAASVLKCSPKRVIFDAERLDEIKEAITKTDIKLLVNDKGIKKKNEKGISKGRTRKAKLQKKKGRRRGTGSRKGRYSARTPKKKTWSNTIRLQRKFLKQLRDKSMLTTKDYRLLYRRAKGGFFRSLSHVKLYINESELIQKGKQNGNK